MLFPNGETTPKPVTTTRLSVQLLAINQKGAAWTEAKLPRKCLAELFLGRFFDVFDDVADAL